MSKLEGVNKGLHELIEKWKEAHNEQLQQEREEMRQLQIRLTKEKDELNELHAREAAIWKEMKKRLEEVKTTYKQEIVDLKKTLQEAQNPSQVTKEHVRIVLHTHREKFTALLKAALEKGWMAWATQAAELHTYRADFVNQKKEGRGFYKLSDDNLASMREDLSKDYRELAAQHSEELSHPLDDFGEIQEELLDRLMEGRNTQQTVPVAKPKITGVEGPADNWGEKNPHESADPTHNEQTQSLESP